MGRMVATQTPRSLYAQFFEEVGETGPLVFEDPPNLGRIVTIGVRYDIEIPPPIAQRSQG
jgi:hypothetical protein